MKWKVPASLLWFAIMTINPDSDSVDAGTFILAQVVYSEYQSFEYFCIVVLALLIK